MRTAMILSLVVLLVLCAGSLSIAAAKKSEMHHVHGEVGSVDAAAMSLTVKEPLKAGGSKDVVFTVADKAKVMIHGKAGKLDEVKVGDSVNVSYHNMKDKTHHAMSISVVKAPATAPAPKS